MSEDAQDIDEMDVIEEMAQRIAANPTDSEAYLRQAQAYFKLEEYEAADKALSVGLTHCGTGEQHKKLRKQLEMWRRKCATHLSGSATVFAQEGGDPVPAEVAQAPAEPKAEPPAQPPAPAKPAIRQDWFQSYGAVTVNLFVKNRTREDITVNATEQSLSVSVRMADGTTTEWAVPRLFAPVDPDSVKVEVKPMKVDIQLTKREQGSWDKLEAPSEPLPAKASGAVKAPCPAPATYPTSSKKGKDWANFKLEEEEEKPEGDAALNKLFQDIYSRGDDETRKAMCKSFTESAGTVLSTNWSEVGKGKVEGSAPKGMQMKDWTTHDTKDHT
eukprot:TRINITY_DN22997_c1_g1_i1.p1 TRINITY_DN22997_c1_g1~~TRINITY_DN22997_c1_g1_i1.p1  ORF type:complete len:357 (+),score=131.94 TRINITY_DN22997_c1_g1_i1:85-1071(+)